MSRDLIRQLKKLRNTNVSPREEWVKENRVLLLSLIKNTLPSKANNHTKGLFDFSFFIHFFAGPWSFVTVRSLAVVLVMAVVFSSTVRASYAASPGEKLYDLKIALERAQVVLTEQVGNREGAKLKKIALAKEIAYDTRKITAYPEKKQHVPTAVSYLKKALEDVNHDLKDKNSPPLAVEAVQETEEIKSLIKESKQNLSESTPTTSDDLAKNLSETTELAKDVHLAVVGAVLTGNSSLSGDVKKQIISSTLQTVATDAVESKKGVEDVSLLVSQAAKTLKNDLTKKEELALPTTTKQFNSDLLAVAAQTKEAAQEAGDATQKVDKKISEIKNFIAQGQIEKAISGIGEANIASKAVETIYKDTITKVQVILPAVVPAVGVLNTMNADNSTSTNREIAAAANTMISAVTSSINGVVTSTATNSPAIMGGVIKMINVEGALKNNGSSTASSGVNSFLIK